MSDVYFLLIVIVIMVILLLIFWKELHGTQERVKLLERRTEQHVPYSMLYNNLLLLVQDAQWLIDTIECGGTEGESDTVRERMQRRVDTVKHDLKDTTRLLELARLGLCKHGYNCDDCPDCRH